jgi:lysophospholipase L1-like esterase
MAIGEILPLGDSITEGFGGTGGGYRARLHLLLNNAGDSFNLVGSLTSNSTPALVASDQHYHEGHSGFRIDQIEGDLTGLVSSDPAFDTSNGGHWLDGGIAVGRPPIFPDLILLHIGTNDANQGRTSTQMQASLQSLLTKIRTTRPNAQVIVASLILRTDNAGREATQMSYNSAIPGIVAAQGANFHFLDMHAVLGPGDLNDGLHPTQAGYDKMADAWISVVHAFAQVEPLGIATAASRKMHGTLRPFDLNLPLTGSPGVECRSDGGSGTHTVLVTFNNKVTSGSATVTNGNGSVSGAPTFARNEMTINLAGVANGQPVLVMLSGVHDAYAQSAAPASITIKVLQGDTTGNGIVNASDIIQTKGLTGAAVTEANFRADVTADGAINSSDVIAVKSRSGSAIP